MTARFSDDAWAANRALYETIRDMPFNRALMAGSLDSARFRHYIVQDAHYLIGFGKALAIAAAKAREADDIAQFAKAAEVAIVVERSLHASYFEQFGISAADFRATPVAPTCHHYVSFLLATALTEPYETVLAALLPCFWIYAEVGRHILARATTPNPYQAWIDTYAGDDFHAEVRRVIATTDRVAEQASPSVRADMLQAFTRACQLEWMFWDAADRTERWPV